MSDELSTPVPGPDPAPPPASFPPAPPESPPSAPPAGNHRRRGRGAVVAVVLLSVLLAAALGVGGYLWYAADRWSADSAVWEAQARSQGQRVAVLEAELEATTRELTSAREQLSTATTRITELADEKAQLGDANAANQALIDYQRRVSDAAATVAEALGRCTDGQGRLIEYLRTPEQFDPDSLQRFGDQVAALCAQATEANSRLQTELRR